MKPEEKLLDLLVERSLSMLKECSKAELDDIYLLSIYIEDEDGDVLPELRLGWNTNTQFKQSLPKASSAKEAKWNYAFWIQNEKDLMMGHKLRTSWMEDGGFYISPELYSSDEELWDQRYRICTDALWNLGAKLGLRLREDTWFTEQFSVEIPIIVHEVHMDGSENGYVNMVNENGQAKEYLLGWWS